MTIASTILDDYNDNCDQVALLSQADKLCTNAIPTDEDKLMVWHFKDKSSLSIDQNWQSIELQ